MEIRTTDDAPVPRERLLEEEANRSQAARAAEELESAEVRRLEALVRTRDEEIATSKNRETKRVAEAATRGVLDGMLEAISEDATPSALKLQRELLSLKTIHLSGDRTQEQTEAWFVERANSLMSKHQERVTARVNNGEDLPDTGIMEVEGAPGQPRRAFDSERYLSQMAADILKRGARWEFEGPNLGPEHEAVKAKLGSAPALDRLYAVSRQSGSPGSAVIPIPYASLDASVRHRFADTYAADGSSLRSPTYRRDALVPFFRPSGLLPGLGVPEPTVDNDLTLPRLSASLTAAWLAENAAITDGGITLANITTSPKRLGVQDDVSWMLLAAADSQFGIVGVIINEIGEALAQTRENGVYLGSGSSNQPRGVNATTGITTVTGSGNPTYRQVMQMVREIAEENIPTAMARFTLSPLAQEVLSTVLRFTAGVVPNATIFRELDSSMIDIGRFGGTWGTMVGHPAGVSTHMPDNLSSNESLILCGVWMYVWSVMYSMAFLTVDDVSRAATGQTRITANAYCDVAVRLPKAFSKYQDQLV